MTNDGQLLHHAGQTVDVAAEGTMASTDSFITALPVLLGQVGCTGGLYGAARHLLEGREHLESATGIEASLRQWRGYPFSRPEMRDL